MKNGTDYTVSYSNNTKVGTAKVTITGKGNYTGSVSKTYSIKITSRKPQFRAFPQRLSLARTSLRALLLNTMAKR